MSSHVAIPNKIPHALIYLSILTSSVVFVEPSITDVFMAALIFFSCIFMPRVVFSNGGGYLFLVVLSYCVFDLFSTLNAKYDFVASVKFSLITIYLFLSFWVVAGFVRLYGSAVFHLIMKGWLYASLLAATVGVLGYFDVIPKELVMRRGEDGVRLQSLFKDPNVFGPYLIPPLLYRMYFSAKTEMSLIKRVAPSILILSAIILTFSRAAYINLAVSSIIFLYLVEIKKHGVLGVLKFLLSSLFFGFLALIIVAVIADYFGVLDYLISRLSLQEYDEGRFSNFIYALESIMNYPLGVGPAQVHLFSYNNIHSLYLAVMLESGVLVGVGLISILVSILSLTAMRMLRMGYDYYIYAFLFSVFVGVLVNSLVVMSLHWRHLFLIMALCCGIYPSMGYTFSRAQAGKKVTALTVSA